MLNFIWLGLIVLAVGLGGWNGRLQELADGAFDGARVAVLDIALPLIGITALWLGMMRLAEKAGLIQTIARLLRAPLRRLFPDVPPEHPAMGSMVMNMAANMIGLTNAATPLGLRAMNDLERLNPHPGTATNAMCTFLALNTSSLQLLPMTAIGIMAAKGGAQPTAIVGTALIATACSTAVGIAAVKILERLRVFRLPSAPSAPDREPAEAAVAPSPDLENRDAADAPTFRPLGWRARLVLALFGVGFVLLLLRLLERAWWEPVWWQTPAVFMDLLGQVLALPRPEPGPPGASGWVSAINAVSLLALPFFLSFFPLYAALKRVPVYEEFVEGAKEGFQVAVRIIPFLVAMLVAIMMFRAAGGVDLLTRGLDPLLGPLGFPPELLPMALTRPLSGSATIGLFTDLVNTLGPDHLVTRMGGTLIGSTETTLYVVAVYFGAVGVRRVRHAVAAGLLADLAGIIASVAICRMMWG